MNTFAEEVQVAAYQFLSGSAFSIDQDTTVGGRYESDLFSQRFDGNAVSHNVKPVFELALKQGIGAFQPAVGERVSRDQQRVVKRQGFFDEVVGSEFRRRDGCG